MDLTGTGVWSGGLRYGDAGRAAEAAAELEELGYTALWVPDASGEVFSRLGVLLAATRRVTIATGILNLWMNPAAEAARGYAEAKSVHGDRLMIGIGVSHQQLIDAAHPPGTYTRPLAATRRYLDELDAQPAGGIPPDSRMLAALGPKMLELAAARTRGTHPYLVTPDHTSRARAALGPGPLVAPEQGVVVESDPSRARQVARDHLATYLQLPNYTNNWLRLGFTDGDLADGGSDRLVDALVAWGDEETIRRRILAHRDAGADHVCIQVLQPEGATGLPLEAWRRLAPVLLD
jgi:probable F420-dependent oxidoreductase